MQGGSLEMSVVKAFSSLIPALLYRGEAYKVSGQAPARCPVWEALRRRFWPLGGSSGVLAALARGRALWLRRKEKKSVLPVTCGLIEGSRAPVANHYGAGCPVPFSLIVSSRRIRSTLVPEGVRLEKSDARPENERWTSVRAKVPRREEGD